MPITSPASLTSLVSIDDHKGNDRFEEIHTNYPTLICLPNNDEFDIEGSYLSLPSAFSGVEIETIISSNHELFNANEELLQQTPIYLSSTSKERVLNILQGEIGHITSSQADIITSNEATTCHILAVRSHSPCANSSNLCSMAHIDRPSYETCLRDLIQTHITHHNCNASIIEMDLHIVGGFNDEGGQSKTISKFLLTTLSKLATTFSDHVRMTLKTCVICGINDTGRSSPIVRGVGLDIRSGEIFVASLDPSISGPALILRRARLWSTSASKKLNVIHDASSSQIIIKPFKYVPFRNIYLFLQLSDDLLLRATSTSPDVECSSYCSTVRSTLNFIEKYKWQIIFGRNCDRYYVFMRSGNTSNEWEKIC